MPRLNNCCCPWTEPDSLVYAKQVQAVASYQQWDCEVGSRMNIFMQKKACKLISQNIKLVLRNKTANMINGMYGKPFGWDLNITTESTAHSV